MVQGTAGRAVKQLTGIQTASGEPPQGIAQPKLAFADWRGVALSKSNHVEKSESPDLMIEAFAIYGGNTPSDGKADRA